MYFKNGSALDVFGEAVDMDWFQYDPFINAPKPFSQTYLHRLTPNLSITVSGDLKLMLTDTEDQSVVIKTLDGLL